REAFSSPTPSALLKDALEKDLPVTEQRLDFVDRCLSGSDNALAHASALNRLAERYDANAEALLSPVSQKRLGEMLRGHSERLRAAVSELDPLMRLLSTPATEKATLAPRDWREAFQTLASKVQEQDTLVTALVAGSRKIHVDGK